MIAEGPGLDFLWMILCGFLVLFMQPGFLCLESGLTRRKNSVNVAAKNLADFCMATVVFWCIGFGIMFGASAGGWYGTDRMFPDFSEQSSMVGAFFFFQLMFCGAAVTVMSGATAERVRLVFYLVIALLVGGLIYPVFGISPALPSFTAWEGGSHSPCCSSSAPGAAVSQPTVR